MRSLFGILHPGSGFSPLSGQAPGASSTSKAWLWTLICLCVGALQAASLAWPFSEWSLPGTTAGQPSGVWQIVSLAVLALGLQRSRRVGQAAWRGWLFAWAWLAGTFWWLFVSMHTYGGLPAWMAVAAVLGLAAALACFYAGAVVLMAVVVPRSRGGQILLFAACWTFAEMARGRWLTGLPWGAGGYAQADLMAGWAPWTGVYGMGAIAAMLAYGLAAGVNALLFVSPRGKGVPSKKARSMPVHGPSWLSILVVLGLLALLSSFGMADRWRALALADTQASAELRVWLLQGNVAQDEKFEAGTGVVQALSWYPEQIRSALQAARTGQPDAPQLVVAPETAVPMLPQQLSADSFWRPLLQPLADQAGGTSSVAALMGLPLGDFDRGYTNSAWGITAETAQEGLAQLAGEADGGRLDTTDGQAGAGFYRYSKHHLVPFGEFIPPLFRWFTRLMNIPLGDFARGEVVQPVWSLAGQRLATNICYEDLFGEELAASFADPAAAPTVLVNLSNIGWFGDTVAIDQHLHISRLRAMELGRPMLRATNTGATAAIDHRGVVTHRLPRLTRNRLVASVEGRTGLTPYAAWASRWGLWPLWAVCVGVWLMALASQLHAQRLTRR